MKKAPAHLKKSAAKKGGHGLNTGLDLVSAGLIISLILNLFVVSLWITLQITSQYDSALIDFFINR